jgi:hypothetical protein
MMGGVKLHNCAINRRAQTTVNGIDRYAITHHFLGKNGIG